MKWGQKLTARFEIVRSVSGIANGPGGCKAFGMTAKRLFVGLGFSDEFKKSLEPWVKKIRKTADQKDIHLKWTPPSNYHVTLVFLGNVSIEDISLYESKMQEVARKQAPFALKIRHISGFPTLNQSRVIYMGVQRSQALLDLQSALEEELVPPEKYENDYTPHLTLARLKNPKSCRDLVSPFEHVDLGRQAVTHIRLYNSVLSRGFPVYEMISEAELAATPKETS